MSYWFYIALAYCSALLNGGIAISSKILATNIPPLVVVLLRFSLGALCLVPFIHWKEFKKIRTKTGIILTSLGFLGIFFANYLYLTGIKETTAINAGIVTSLVPIFVLLFHCILYNERPTIQQILAFIISFFGVTLIVTKGDITALNAISRGDFYILGSAMCWGTFGIMVKVLAQHNFSSVFITFIADAVGSFFTFLAMDHSKLHSVVTNLSLYQWLLLIYIATLGTAFNYFIYSKAMRNLGPPLAAFIIYGNIPVFVVLLSYFLLNEPFLMYQIIGILLIIFALYLSQSGSDSESD